MKTQHYEDAQLFLQDHSGFLASTNDLQMRNNLSLGILDGLSKKSQEDVYMLAVQNEQGKPVLTALMTPPHNLVLSQGDQKAVPFLIQDILQRKTKIPGILGPEEIATSFAAQWKTITGTHMAPRLKMTLYAVTKVNMPKQVLGRFRRAESKDKEWLTDWIQCFAEDAALSVQERKRDPDGTDRKIKDGRLYIWENNGQPVSIAGFVPVTQNGVRIGSVYTPESERGKGYATACVAHLSQRLLDQERKWCSLFADTANPVPNGIYKKIGYNERFTYQEFKLGK